MDEISVRQYTENDKADWDSFVSKSKNATFLFYRDFMEYHQDRFQDYSLMIYRKEKLYAVLPAHRVGEQVISHHGLTYGGLALSEKATFVHVYDAYKLLLKYLNDQGVSTLEIKMIPTFYNSMPSDELEYLLYRSEAKLLKKDILMVIDYNHRRRFEKNRREGINKAKRAGLEIKIDKNFEGFWNEVLIPNLSNKHDAEPVHSLEEIQLLANRFPEHIKQVSVYHEGKIVAGTTVFLTKTTVHPQYVSGNADKNTLGSLDLLYDFIIDYFQEDRRYFDFNTSSEENGQILNQGLLFWKETCGAQTFTADNYLVATASYKRLNLQLK